VVCGVWCVVCGVWCVVCVGGGTPHKENHKGSWMQDILSVHT
jgi:hypothetical protein